MKTLGQLMAYNLIEVCETNIAVALLNEERVRAAAAKAEGKPMVKQQQVASSSDEEIEQKTAANEKALAEEDVKTASKRAYGALLAALSADQLRLVQHVALGDAYGVWSTLLAHYERKSVATRVGLIESLFTLKMEGGESINLYAARVTEMNRKLAEQEEIISNTVLLFVLLRGLPSRYDTIVTLLKMKEMVWLDVIEALKNEEERQKNAVDREEQGHYAKESRRGGNSGGGSGGGGGTGTGQPGTCFTCGKTGHIKFHCPKNAGKKKCSRCHRVGHTAQECRSVSDAATQEEQSSYAMAEEQARRAQASWNDEDW
jgi:uncharacterized membrane protein YgcG